MSTVRAFLASATAPTPTAANMLEATRGATLASDSDSAPATRTRAVEPSLDRSDVVGPRARRAISHRWDTGTTAENGDRVCVDVTTSHDRERREYWTTLRVVEVGDTFVRWAAYAGRDGRPTGAVVERTPVERYNARQLQLLHASVVLDLRGRQVADTSTAGADIMSRVPRES